MLTYLVVTSFVIVCLVSCGSSVNQERQPEQLKHDLFSVSFPTEKEGWACGRWGTVLHSSDGGKTWVSQKSGVDYTLSAISFVDARNGWAVGDGGTIIHTKDGGQNWVRQGSPVPYFLMGVCFINASKGWIVGERTTILYTDDGGSRWEIQFKDEDFILKAVSFSDGRHGWAVGEYGYIYHTGDGGKLWEHQGGEFGFSERTGDVIGGHYLFDVSAVDGRTAYIVGIDGYAAKTLNGGREWREVRKGLPMRHLFCALHDGADRVFIGGTGMLLFSPDGGRNWRRLELRPSVKYGWIYGLCRRGNAGFAAVGSEGCIYLSDKDGLFWNLAVY